MSWASMRSSSSRSIRGEVKGTGGPELGLVVGGSGIGAAGLTAPFDDSAAIRPNDPVDSDCTNGTTGWEFSDDPDFDSVSIEQRYPTEDGAPLFRVPATQLLHALAGSYEIGECLGIHELLETRAGCLVLPHSSSLIL